MADDQAGGKAPQEQNRQVGNGNVAPQSRVGGLAGGDVPVVPAKRRRRRRRKPRPNNEIVLGSGTPVRPQIPVGKLREAGGSGLAQAKKVESGRHSGQEVKLVSESKVSPVSLTPSEPKPEVTHGFQAMPEPEPPQVAEREEQIDSGVESAQQLEPEVGVELEPEVAEPRPQLEPAESEMEPEPESEPAPEPEPALAPKSEPAIESAPEPESLIGLEPEAEPPSLDNDEDLQPEEAEVVKRQPEWIEPVRQSGAREAEYHESENHEVAGPVSERRESEVRSEVKHREEHREVVRHEPETHESAHPRLEEMEEGNSPLEKFLDNSKAFFDRVFAGFGSAGGSFGVIFSRKTIATFIVLVLLAGGGYFAYVNKWHESAVNFVTGFFKPKPVETVEVNYDETVLKSFGIITSGIFARNDGSVHDAIPVQIRLADYFGHLMEPAVKGETGISAATFYGELRDDAAAINQFVLYMQFMEKLQNLFKIDVYAMLDRTTDRATALLDYLASLKQASEDGARLNARIKLNIDDFMASYNSLSPDKSQYEKDFFAAMEQLQPEKSDLLLKGFIDASQKQVALKARVSALNKLSGYYDTALKRLDTRISAVDKNRAALIQGIHVVDVPGAELNIIIKSN
jgi:hypothetical protein